MINQQHGRGRPQHADQLVCGLEIRGQFTCPACDLEAQEHRARVERDRRRRERRRRLRAGLQNLAGAAGLTRRELRAVLMDLLAEPIARLVAELERGGGR